MDYKELSNKAISEIALKLCWDSFSDKDQQNFLNQAKDIWNKKILDLALESVEEVEKYYK